MGQFSVAEKAERARPAYKSGQYCEWVPSLSKIACHHYHYHDPRQQQQPVAKAKLKTFDWQTPAFAHELGVASWLQTVAGIYRILFLLLLLPDLLLALNKPTTFLGKPNAVFAQGCPEKCQFLSVGLLQSSQGFSQQTILEKDIHTSRPISSLYASFQLATSFCTSRKTCCRVLPSIYQTSNGKRMPLTGRGI